MLEPSGMATMSKPRASTRVSPRVTPRAKQAYVVANALERAITGRSAGQLMSLLYSHRRNWLMRLARERGIDTSSIIKPRASSRPPMPENIDRIDPFI